MKGFLAKLCKKSGIAKRIFSVALSVILMSSMVQSLPAGILQANAASGDTNITIHFYNGEWNWGAPAIQYWGGSNTTITGEASGPDAIPGWGANDKGYTMTSEGDGWYSLTIKGDFDGFQFLDMSDPSHNTAGAGYNSYMSQYKGNTPTDLWYKTGTNVWYTDKACTNQLSAPANAASYNIKVHYYNGTNKWSEVAVKIAEGGSWTAVSGYEKYNSWPGVKLTEDAEHPDWYSIDVTKYTTDEFHCIFNDNVNGSGNQTNNINITVEDATAEYWYYDNALVTAAPDAWTGSGSGSQTPAFTEQTVTVHFNNDKDWSEVNAYMGFTGNFNSMTHNSLAVYTYTHSWPGAEVEKDPDNTGWYSFKITTDVSELALIFNNGEGGSQTNNIVFTPDSEQTEIWVTSDSSISQVAPTGWTTNTKTINPPVDPNANLNIESPVINANGTVTFNALAGSYTKAEIMGDLSTWTPGSGLAMSKDGDIYTYTTTNEVKPGSYRYKFVFNDGVWKEDALNNLTADGNSILVVPGLQDADVKPEKNVSTDLPKTFKLFTKGQISSTDVAVTYTLDDTSLADVVTIDNTNYKIMVDKACTSKEFTLTATTADGKTANLYVKPQEKVYNYTIYYYDFNENHMAADATDLWIWGNDGNEISTPVTFTTETLSDGNTWLKVTVATPSTDFGFKTRAFGSWSWEDANHTYENTDKKENVTLYIVNGDAETYTSIPSLVKPRERYVLVSYKRANDDYSTETTGWNLYSWNSGISSSTEIYTEEMNGEQIMKMPIRDSAADFTLGFIVRNSEKSSTGDKWLSKDGGDNYVVIPKDQEVVKFFFEEGKGVVGTLPYNMSYEMDGKNASIHFYYRDDAVLAAKNSAKLDETVKVVIGSDSYEMTYDETNERYCYTLQNCTTGTYSFSYLVGGKKVEDKFGDGTVSYKSYSDLGIKATLTQSSMDYNDNNVLSVSFTGTDAANISQSEVESITADLTELGLSSIYAISPELMEGTISVTRGTSLGSKDIPVSVKDIYGHIYTTTATVEVVARDEDSFDWDEAVIYMTCTDRFYDGNTSNNDGVDKTAALGWHGGDFAGLTEKLDYLKELGVNTIWITPIVENANASSDGATGYHGYWATDFTKLNSYLGTEEEFATLLSEAHNRGMKIMVDVVLNHAGYGATFTLKDGTNMLRDSSNTIAGDDVYDGLSGLPDFVTENAAVRDQIIDWQVDWMKNYDIDYYRVDTVKHVDTVTWQAFKNELTKVNPDFKLIGEYAGAGYASTGGTLGTGMMDSLLDFDTNDKALSFVQGDISNVELYYQKRDSSIDNTATLGGFLSSHDEDSFVDKLMSDNKTEEEALALAKVAASLQMTAKGQVVIYQGEEVGQHGLDNYPLQTNRADFEWNRVTEQNGVAGSMLTHYQKLLDIRETYSTVLATGTRTSVASDNTKGYDVFKRSADGTDLFVALNITDEANTVSFGTATADGTIYTDLYSGGTYKVAGGVLTVSIPANEDGGTMVLVKTGYEQPADTTTGNTSDGTTTDKTTSTENNKKPSTSKKDDNDTTAKEDVVKDSDVVEVPKDVTTVTPVVDEKVQNAVEKEVDKILQDVEKDEASSEVLSEETIANVKKAQENGTDILTEIIAETIDESKVDAAVKTAMEKALKEKGEENTGIISYLDLSVLLKTKDGEALGKVNKLSSPVSFTIAIPTDMQKEGRTFVVLRMHDGETTILETTMNADGTVSFETDRFSTYALAYIDEAVSTDTADDGDTTDVGNTSGSHVTQESESNFTTFIIIGLVVVVIAAVFIMFLALKNKKNK